MFEVLKVQEIPVPEATVRVIDVRDADPVGVDPLGQNVSHMLALCLRVGPAWRRRLPRDRKEQGGRGPGGRSGHRQGHRGLRAGVAGAREEEPAGLHIAEPDGAAQRGRRAVVGCVNALQPTSRTDQRAASTREPFARDEQPCPFGEWPRAARSAKPHTQNSQTPTSGLRRAGELQSDLWPTGKGLGMCPVRLGGDDQQYHQKSGCAG